MIKTSLKSKRAAPQANAGCLIFVCAHYNPIRRRAQLPAVAPGFRG
jgi:hypothetical protein